MKLFALSALVALLPLVSATYFTEPVQSTVWDTPVGKTITWKYQAGGAVVGTIALVTDNANPKAGTEIILAQSVDLTTESLTWPAGLEVPSISETSFRLVILNAEDQTTVYSSVGPFTIQSLGGEAPPTTTTARRGRTSVALSQTSTTSQAVVAPTTPPAPGPAPSTTSIRPPGPATTSSNPPPPPPPVSLATAPSSSSSPRPAPSSSSSSSSAAPVVATVISTASMVTLTSISRDNGNVVTIVSTATRSSASSSSSSLASGVVGAASQVARPTSAAAKRGTPLEALLPRGWTAAGTALLGVAVGVAMLA